MRDHARRIGPLARRGPEVNRGGIDQETQVPRPVCEITRGAVQRVVVAVLVRAPSHRDDATAASKMARDAPVEQA
jgi:hypothetical protein